MTQLLVAPLVNLWYGKEAAIPALVFELVQRSTENLKVTGSTPDGATTGKLQFFGTGAFLL
jgi:hypothetical protein